MQTQPTQAIDITNMDGGHAVTFIGSDEDGYFTHQARPAEVPAESTYAFLRYFPTVDQRRWVDGVEAGPLNGGFARVYRNAREDHAQVEMSVLSANASSEMFVNFSADALRQLACALLDAAHDLDTHPAAELTAAAGAPA